MTREEAIRKLQKYVFDDEECIAQDMKDYNEALKMAIEALQFADKSPRTVKLTEDIKITLDEEAYEIGYTHGQMADRPKGEWIEVEDYNGDVHYKCDQCGEEWTFPFGTPIENNANFCPNCGARMKGGAE